MSGLARVLQRFGYVVTGSDSTESPAVRSLRDEGVSIVIGHDDPSLAGQAALVVSTRRAELHAATELEAARENGAVIVKRGQLLGMIANPLRSIAVAGTHGKSTTSGMLTVAMLKLGEKPGFAVGAMIPGLDRNTEAGDGTFMVVEADEFDRSFHWLTPEIAIITSVSFDHPDIYMDQAAYDDAFVTFARSVNPGGSVVIAGDDPGARRVIDRLRALGGDGPQIFTFGELQDMDWMLRASGEGWIFRDPAGVEHAANLAVPGTHNARNAIAAAAALSIAGFETRESISALETFTGVGRRFEHKGQINGIDVVDDYAHHPEEISAVIRAARMRYPDRRIVAVHQPHTFSRTKILLREFAESLDGADSVVLLDIYPGGEDDHNGVSSHDLLALINVPAYAASGPASAASQTAAIAKPGDVVLTLGAGDITQTGSLLLDHLNAQVAERPKRTRTALATVQIPDAPGLKVMRDAPMSMFTTMRLGGTADFLVRTPTVEDVLSAIRWAAREGMPTTVIGGGSNLLVGDDGIRGVVIVARTPGERADGLLEFEDLGETVRVTVGAQAPLSWVGRYCAEQGWSGMDWGVGLPGQIGGATVNNAGAHGTELKDNLVAIDLLHMNGDVERVPGVLARAVLSHDEDQGSGADHGTGSYCDRSST